MRSSILLLITALSSQATWAGPVPEKRTNYFDIFLYEEANCRGFFGATCRRKEAGVCCSLRNYAFSSANYADYRSGRLAVRPGIELYSNRPNGRSGWVTGCQVKIAQGSRCASLGSSYMGATGAVVPYVGRQRDIGPETRDAPKECSSPTELFWEEGGFMWTVQTNSTDGKALLKIPKEDTTKQKEYAKKHGKKVAAPKSSNQSTSQQTKTSESTAKASHLSSKTPSQTSTEASKVTSKTSTKTSKATSTKTSKTLTKKPTKKPTKQARATGAP